MGNTPDVRVRLSAEGEQQVINAFRKIQGEADRTGKLGARSLNAFGKSISGLTRLLPGLTFVGAIAGAAYLAKQALETGDRMAKLSRQFGVNVEMLSSYSLAAQLGGTDMEAFAKGLQRLSRTASDAARGLQSAQRPFRDLGIETKDQAGNLRPLDDILGDVADKFSRMADGPRKAALAQELFGRSGTDLIPILNQGRAGLEATRKEAEKLGLVWTKDTARAAELFNDNMTKLRGTVRGFVNRELAGLLPALIATSNALLDASVDADKFGLTLGQKVLYEILGAGAAIRALGATIKDFSTKGGFGGVMTGAVDFRENLERELEKVDEIIRAHWPETPGATHRGEVKIKPIVDETARAKVIQALKQFQEAEYNVQKAALDNETALFRAHSQVLSAADQKRFNEGLISVKAYFAGRRATLEAEGAKEIKALEDQATLLRDRVDAASKRPLKENEPKMVRQAEVAKLLGDLDKAGVAVEVRKLKLQTERINLDGEELQITRQKSAEALKAESDLATAEGRRFEAERLNLEATLTALQRLPAETEAAFAARRDALREAGEAAIQFEEIQSQARAAFQDLETQRAQIQALVERGIISELDGEQRLAEIEKERLPGLAQIVEEMRAAAFTSEQIETVQQFEASLLDLETAADLAGRRMADLKKAIEAVLTSDLADFFARGIDEVHGFGDAVRSMALSVVQSLREIAAQALATYLILRLMKAVTSVLGGGGVEATIGESSTLPVAGAAGGLVRGPGTGTSDSIPAWLSTGEFVMPAEIVRKPGMLQFLQDLRSFDMELKPLGRIRGFAGGGVVDSDVGAGRIAGLRGEIALDEGLIWRHLESRHFDRLLMRKLSDHRKALKLLTT